MATDSGKKNNATSNAAKKRAARYRASAITAAVAAIALIAITVMSWRLSSASHHNGDSVTTTSNVIEVAIMGTLTRTDLLASIESQTASALEELRAEAEDKAGEPEEVPSIADFSPEDFDSISQETHLSAFSLSGEAPEVSDGDTADIQDAIKAAESMGTVGIVFMDASTGCGLAYNVDAAVYGASSFKGPYAVYVCQELVDSGRIDLDSPVDVASSNSGSIAIDPASSWATSGASAYPTDELIRASVVESDNDAYGMLRNQYDTQGYDKWITGLGVSDAPRDPLSWYPTYCARSSAKLWANALLYLDSGTETAGWLADLFGQTRTSFIRDGLASTSDGRSATVLDKAGWISDANPAYNAVCDAGIIEADGRTYIMCIMTSQPDCAEARSNVAELAVALFEARGLLE